MIQFFLNESLSEVRQAGGDRKGGKFQNPEGGSSIDVVGTICPPGWDRVNRSAKVWGYCPPPPPAPHNSNSPEVTEKAESLTRSKIDFLWQQHLFLDPDICLLIFFFALSVRIRIFVFEYIELEF